ncbi:class I SAM-dependent methyltransferase [uncultured Tateyamaria sp.]|uniref:class I SAM-dependent methyltransferase n=1 Tax=uncultured Tateyamaria sp. TaxID=455651 RepID=UPI0026243426|nr:methyltransferase domain-containing protein [uncultured Tateyamaria sp.]
MLTRFTRFDQPRPAAQPGALQAIYDRAATGWQDGISKLGFLAAYAELMRATAPPTPAPSVLDVGTGTGAFAQAWSAAHGAPATLTLTDISPAMLETASARLPNAITIIAPLGPELNTLPPQDVVLCAHVIEHIDDPKAAFGMLFDRVASGGMLVLALSRPHWCTALVRWRWGNAAYPPGHAHTMLAEAGFTDITLHPFTSGPPSRVSHGYIARRP